jgi:hypothetical protein
MNSFEQDGRAIRLLYLLQTPVDMGELCTVFCMIESRAREGTYQIMRGLERIYLYTIILRPSKQGVRSFLFKRLHAHGKLN